MTILESSYYNSSLPRNFTLSYDLVCRIGKIIEFPISNYINDMVDLARTLDGPLNATVLSVLRLISDKLDADVRERLKYPKRMFMVTLGKLLGERGDKLHNDVLKPLTFIADTIFSSIILEIFEARSNKKEQYITEQSIGELTIEHKLELVVKKYNLDSIYGMLEAKYGTGDKSGENDLAKLDIDFD